MPQKPAEILQSDVRRRGSASGSRPDVSQQPFDIARALADIVEAIRPFPPAALFALAAEGFSSLFELLVACMISIRTYDEVTVPCAHRLFARARDAVAMSQLSPQEIGAAIADCTFAPAKAQQIHAMACQVVSTYGGILPGDATVLQSFRGVGPKCTNLALGIACQQLHISVDVHVHRITNRWGYVQTSTPERTMLALEAILPQRYWIDLNRLLVPFGKHICVGQRPYCSRCPVRDMCQQVGVKAPR